MPPAMQRALLRPVAATLAIVTALTGCSSITRNHERGFAALGTVTAIFGVTTLADGVSCDSRYNAHSTCTHDSGELRDGALITTAGLALLGFGLWRLHVDDRPDEEPHPRRAAPAPIASASATSASPATPASRLAPRD